MTRITTFIAIATAVIGLLTAAFKLNDSLAQSSGTKAETPSHPPQTNSSQQSGAQSVISNCQSSVGGSVGGSVTITCPTK